MASGYQPAYIGPGPQPFGFTPATTTVAPTCTVAAPCWTTPTGQANNGQYAYGTPFSQPEIDRLRGGTFQYLHPFGDNLISFSYDFHSDDTSSTSGDTTPVYPGCTEVVGSISNAAPSVVGTPPPAAGLLGRQPGCALTNLPRTSVGIPPTQIRVSDFALTGLFQVNPALQLALGAYYEHYNSRAQTEDPNVLNNFALNNCTSFKPAPALPGTCLATTTASAPVSLVTVTHAFSHFDPHVGLTYRAGPNTVIRATAGSSVTMPFAFFISGLGSVTIPNAANNQQYTVSLANTGLKPETTVAYNLGLDTRLPDGGVFSTDIFNNTVHNIFMSQSIGVPCPAAFDPAFGGTATGGCFQSQTVNGPIGRYYGLELAFNKNVPVGFGYTLTGTLERAYLDQLPLSLYATGFNQLVSGKQLDGSALSQGSVPYAKGYGEARWTAGNNQLFSFGARWEGANNSTYGPSFTLFNATARWNIVPKTTFQLAVDNLFNLSTGTDVVRALFGQGNKTITAGVSNGNLVYSNLATPKSIQQLAPRTIRFTLSRRFQ
ncbi:MAG: TonB-dependent receptor [Candidatus Eremiobacteraeota bacterium]|nr:TonB-dependent receptor [Candidatus Eremiobacteraeota bacterium]